ncbi:replication associated protein [Lake Sarah-associated circular molecule 6]|uniref:replication associated protein n=1 Tax=Lake Sarah-associated circular molecule 6 TaxID=1685731 RepID=UPI000776D8FD|nr:replication associated protein [Lake Sarah-associated circular molecule 6]ALE29546.1 replication associated protein [Lake Sarah-associated circular molecule 6]ALE29547.1 replication associated protein [Lake Sarah-associated circular molecule 6]
MLENDEQPIPSVSIEKPLVSRGWCFTCNNYSESDYNGFLAAESVYLVIGKEISSTGTPHLQGYIYFRTEKSLRTLRKLSDRSHWEPAKGDSDSNFCYCSKGENFIERGTRPATGKRKAANGLAKIKENYAETVELAKKGKLDEIDPGHLLRFYGSIKSLQKDNLVRPSDSEELTGLWIYGPSGCGKSKYVRDTYGQDFYYKLANKWWDGYRQEETVLIEDLGTEHDKLGHHLKLWSDRYAFSGETKGGMLSCRPKRIVVTSQYSIEEIFLDEKTQEALNRRFTKLRLFNLKST